MLLRIGHRAWQVIAVFLACTAPALGISTGITTGSLGGFETTTGCNDCHGGGTVPTVELSGPRIVLPLSTHTYSLTVSNPGLQTRAGLNVAADAGTFALGGPDSANTKLLSSEVTHTGPKLGVSGFTTFSFQWTAPASFTSITMKAWGNAVNLNGNTAGDRASGQTILIGNENIVGTATPTDTATATATPTATPTPTPPLCDLTPRTCTTPASSSLAIVDNPDNDAKDSLTLKWNKGPTTDIPDFGDPTDDNDYALCVYQDGMLHAELEAPAAGLCANNKDCWVPKKKGFAYKDKLATPNGLTAISLAVGSEPGKAKIQVKAKGINLPEPVAIPVDAAVTAQLVQRNSSTCWGDSWSGLEIDNDGIKFKAKSAN